MEEFGISAVVTSKSFEFIIGNNRYNKGWNQNLHFSCILVFRCDSRLKLIDHRLAAKNVTKLKSTKDILPHLKDIESKTGKKQHLVVYITNALTFTHSVREAYFEKTTFHGLHGGKGPFCAVVFGIKGKEFSDIFLTARSEKPFKVEKQIFLPKFEKARKKVKPNKPVIPYHLPLSVSEEHSRILQSQINCVGYIYRNMGEYFRKITPVKKTERKNYKNKISEVMNYLYKYNSNLNELMEKHKKTDVFLRNFVAFIQQQQQPQLQQPHEMDENVVNDLKEKVKYYEKLNKDILDEKVLWKKRVHEKEEIERQLRHRIGELEAGRKKMIKENKRLLDEKSGLTKKFAIMNRELGKIRSQVEKKQKKKDRVKQQKEEDDDDDDDDETSEEEGEEESEEGEDDHQEEDDEEVEEEKQEEPGKKEEEEVEDEEGKSGEQTPEKEEMEVERQDFESEKKEEGEEEEKGDEQPLQEEEKQEEEQEQVEKKEEEEEEQEEEKKEEEVGKGDENPQEEVIKVGEDEDEKKEEEKVEVDEEKQIEEQQQQQEEVEEQQQEQVVEKEGEEKVVEVEEDREEKPVVVEKEEVATTTTTTEENDDITNPPDPLDPEEKENKEIDQNE